MEFSPSNNIVRLCLLGMETHGKGETDEAIKLFAQAWSEATYDFEKFISAHFLARYQKDVSDKLRWFETALQFALKINDDAVHSAHPSLYLEIAKCHENLGHSDQAKKNYELAISSKTKISSKGPFYHGTKADLQVGDLLTSGGSSNYKSELKMNHIYFTGLLNGAGLAAALAKGDKPERVYVVEPTGEFENDPNVTDKKFPGNPTRSYRSEAPLKIVGEVKDWIRQTPEQIKKWREKLANNKGEIIN
jgi:rifampin ADP-ribosylating transferase